MIYYINIIQYMYIIIEYHGIKHKDAVVICLYIFEILFFFYANIIFRKSLCNILYQFKRN